MKHAVVLAVALLGYLGAARAEPPTVRACDNDQDYPPFRWSQQMADGRTEVRGLGFTLLRQILAKHGWRLELELLPLRRCLQEVATGKRFQIIISSSPNPERLKTYRVTDPFDEVHFHSFYLQSRFPDRAPVHNKSDLLNHRVCGIAGHNFAMFGLPPERIDTGAENFSAVFQMLRSGRCEVLPYNLEAIAGLRLIGLDVLGSGEFGHEAIADVEPMPLVMLIAKPYRYGQSLQQLINRELAMMRASGELQQLQQAFRTDGNAAALAPQLPPPTPQ
jgi:polar amino acid transport system substrate-binding protein